MMNQKKQQQSGRSIEDGNKQTTTTAGVKEILHGKVLFPERLHLMLDSCNTNIVGWNKTGDCIIIHESTAFAKEVLPEYFRQSHLDSFKRQLNAYGFKGAFPVYSHPSFRRNRLDLARSIKRPAAAAAKKRSQSKHDDGAMKQLSKKKGGTTSRVGRPSSSTMSSKMQKKKKRIPSSSPKDEDNIVPDDGSSRLALKNQLVRKTVDAADNFGPLLAAKNNTLLSDDATTMRPQVPLLLEPLQASGTSEETQLGLEASDANIMLLLELFDEERTKERKNRSGPHTNMTGFAAAAVNTRGRFFSGRIRGTVDASDEDARHASMLLDDAEVFENFFLVTPPTTMQQLRHHQQQQERRAKKMRLEAPQGVCACDVLGDFSTLLAATASVQRYDDENYSCTQVMGGQIKQRNSAAAASTPFPDEYDDPLLHAPLIQVTHPSLLDGIIPREEGENGPHRVQNFQQGQAKDDYFRWLQQLRDSTR